MRGGTILILGHGIKGQGHLWHSVYDLVGRIQTTVFAQSLSNFTCKLWMMRGGTVLILGHGVKGQLCVQDLVGRIQTTVFAQSLSNFTCKLWLMRGGTLLILGHGVKGQGHFWHSVYKTLWTQYRLVFVQSLSNFTCKLWLMRGGSIDFGSQVKVNFGTLCIKHRWYNTDYSLCPITFKLHMKMMRGETVLILVTGSPCEGMPRFALSSYSGNTDSIIPKPELVLIFRYKNICKVSIHLPSCHES